MKALSYIALVIILLSSCRKYYDAPVPDLTWDLFNSPAAVSLDSSIRSKLEGVYTTTTGSDFFGPAAALKWSYTANGPDTTFYLSFYCEKDVSYFICQGKRIDSTILLNGYWRKMASTATGKARFTISAKDGADQLLHNDSDRTANNIIIEGVYGIGESIPDQPIRLSYARPLYHRSPLEMVVHRGGGQTADLLPASENTTEIIQMASRFGATGIEVDVRLTRDGVPILYHDPDLSERLIQKNGMVGPIENYTYDQLNALVRLVRGGERIPTLQQALQAVLGTPLRYVWLDIKFHSSLELIRNIQEEYLQKAMALGKQLEITIGIPDQTVLNNFISLPDYKNIPSVCELDPPFVEKANSEIWGPRWTLGLQNAAVEQIHAEGRRAFVWTLDIPQNIYDFMTNGHFDGILTDYPSAVAYYYYVQQ